MQELSFFDCSCSFGMRSIVNPGSFYKLEDLLRKMEYYGIKKALVYRSMAREYNPVMGNEMLINEIKDIPALEPVWVVMPHHTGEFPEPALLKKQMKDKGVKAVRMFPSISDHNYSFSEWNCGELFSMLETTGIPLLIGLDQITWDALHDALSRHPGMKVILTDVNYRVDRNLFALLKKFDNLYVETFGYKQHHGIEEFCKRFGAHRLIFGSGMPVYSGSAAVAMINYARISDGEKRMIAYENLEKLMGGVRYE